MRYVFILMVFLCVSCGTALPTVKPYKLDVQQGNVVTSKMLLQLRPSMTKSQVRFIMGTPLIQDSFHGNRWDYVYQMRENGKITEQRRVILDFENDVLKAVRGDVIPSGGNANKSDDDENIGTRVLKPYQKPEEKGLMDKLQFWKGDESKLPAKPVINNATSDAAKPIVAVPSVAAPVQKATDSNPVATVAENASPAAAEVKSVLVVPEVAASTVAEVATVVAPSVVAVEVAPTQSAPAVAQVESAPESVQVAQTLSEKAPVYESSSGMQFDRTLKYLDEIFEQKAQPAAVVPRAGNKIPPKPKDLPTENNAGFFDRMLEKIGF